MKYIFLILLSAWVINPIQAQNEKKIKILPFQLPKEKAKRPRAPQKKQSGSKTEVDKKLMEKVDTVDDYLKRNSQPMAAPSSSSSSYTSTVPGFIAGERSRYQNGKTPSTTQNVPFTFGPYDPYDQDARNRPANTGSYTEGGNGAGMSVDMNKALSMVFSKNARLRAKNAKKRIWEKYPKVKPKDSLVQELNNKPQIMLSRKQQKDSLSTTSSKRDSVAIVREPLIVKKKD